MKTLTHKQFMTLDDASQRAYLKDQNDHIKNLLEDMAKKETPPAPQCVNFVKVSNA